MISYRHADILKRLIKRPYVDCSLTFFMRDDAIGATKATIEDNPFNIKMYDEVNAKVRKALNDTGFELSPNSATYDLLADPETPSVNDVLEAAKEFIEKQEGMEDVKLNQLNYPSSSFIYFRYYPQMKKTADILKKLKAVPHKQAEQVKIEDLRHGFDEGIRVRYVPDHAHQDINHADIEDGTISSWNHKFVFVHIDSHLGETSQACDPRNLIWMFNS